ncbi:FAD/NAD(P)-binding protein [Streptococcus cameli]
MTKTIGIIGMGVSGFAVLLAFSQLPKDEQETLTIVCFDDSDHFGRGIPFQEDVEMALINSPIDDISFDYRNMNDFTDWMRENGYDTGHPYVSRSLYGQYMKDRGESLMAQIQARLVRKRVEQIHYLSESQQWQVEVEGERVPWVFDEIHLACGELPTIDPYKLEGNPCYIANPYPIYSLEEIIKKNRTVAVVGMGLAAVDVLKWLLHQTKIKVVVFSRSNYFPTVRIMGGQQPSWTVMIDAKFEELRQKKDFSFTQFETLFQSELAALGFENWNQACSTYLKPGIEGLRLADSYPKQLYLLQHLASRVADWFTDLWPLLSDSDREAYKRVYQKHIVNLRNPMPEDSARDLIAAEEDGRLTILKEVVDIESLEQGFAIGIKNQQETRVVDFVVNATGYHLKPDNQENATPLLKQMLDDGFIQIDAQGGISVLVDSAKVISPRFGTVSNLYAHGELINGLIYQNNSTIKIQKMADRAVQASQRKKFDRD